jgi:hypothetical protein
MNVFEAVKKLKQFGWSAYNRNNEFVVYDTKSYSGRYTNRELISLSKSLRSNNWRRTTNKKCSVGYGGKHCPCCTRGTPSEMKRWEKRAVRRMNKVIDLGDEIE